MIIYDCEIRLAIPSKDGMVLPGVEYCQGWRDFPKMGLACIGVYDYREERYRVFCQDNFHEFQRLVYETDLVVGFNSLAFDNILCAFNGIHILKNKSYDLLAEIWAGCGLGPKFEQPSHDGFGLSAVCKANFGCEKTGDGVMAPVLWQRGNIGAVIDYCLNDIRLTKMILDQVVEVGKVWDPRDGQREIEVRKPGADGPGETQ
jgi:hypothetical protein